VITTEKDSVRFPRLGKRSLPIYFLRVEIEIIRGHDAFHRCLEQMCRYPQTVDSTLSEPHLVPA
jgi:tetraacyldisaccharide 4'-kinase